MDTIETEDAAKVHIRIWINSYTHSSLPVNSELL
jgi:hypothetical protein